MEIEPRYSKVQYEWIQSEYDMNENKCYEIYEIYIHHFSSLIKKRKNIEWSKNFDFCKISIQHFSKIRKKK